MKKDYHKKIIVIDMDGTVAGLYDVPDWLDKLLAEDTSPYEEAKPLVDMEKLNKTLMLLQKAGWEIQIISAMCKNATPEYKKAIREAKKAWLKKWSFVYDRFHGVDYKTPKCEVVRPYMPYGMSLAKELQNPAAGMPNPAEAILVDDESRHLDRWHWGRTINPTNEDLIEELRRLLPPDIQEEEDEIEDRYTLEDLGNNWW